MSQQQISLYIDVQNRQLVRSNSTTIPATLPDVFQGDTLGLYLEFLNATGSNSVPYTDIDFSAAAVTVAIGTIGAQPTAGNFTITDPAATQTTGNISYNASASAVQTAIRAALTTNWSTATVTGSNGGPFTITNGSNGAQTALIGSSVNLTPVSSVSIGTIQTGTSDLPQIQYVEVIQNPIALQNTWTPYPAPTATVSRLQAGSGTANEIQLILLGNNPYSGAFIANFGGQTSNPIQFNATPAAVQTALQAMSSIGSGNVSVGGSAGAWVVTFTGSLALASQSLMTTVATGLVGPLALTGNLSLNTAAIEEIIGETTSITQTFAIRVTPSGGYAFTCLQDQITIYNDLIVGAPSIPTPGVSYYTTVESDARYPILSSGLVTVADGGTGVGTLTGLVKGNGTSAFTAAVAGTDYVAGSSVSVVSGKTLTVTNSLTLSGTDGSTLDVGTGGALGTAAYVSPDSSVNAVLPNPINNVSGLVTLDGSANLDYPATSTVLADSSGNLYSTLTSDLLLASGGTGSPVTGVSLGDGLNISGGTLAVNSTYGVASGTNTYTVALSPAPASYYTGLIVTIKFTNANTGSSTLNLNSLGTATIQLNGSAVTSGQIVANSSIQLVYDGTQFQIIT